MKVVKRDGYIVDYDPQKVRTAIQKANVEVSPDDQVSDEQVEEIVKYFG